MGRESGAYGSGLRRAAGLAGIRMEEKAMTDAERQEREQDLRQRIEQGLPGFVKGCQSGGDVVLMTQDAFAADYQDEEYALLGRAVKYAGLLQKEVHVIPSKSVTHRSGESAPREGFQP